MRTLYSYLVQNHINYGLLIFGSNRYIGKVHILQKKAIQIINDKHFNYHIELLFNFGNIKNPRSIHLQRSYIHALIKMQYTSSLI